MKVNALYKAFANNYIPLILEIYKVKNMKNAKPRVTASNYLIN